MAIVRTNPNPLTGDLSPVTSLAHKHLHLDNGQRSQMQRPAVGDQLSVVFNLHLSLAFDLNLPDPVTFTYRHATMSPRMK